MTETKQHAIAVGVDIGGTKTAVGVVDSRGKFLLEATMPTLARKSARAFITRLAAKIEDLLGCASDGYVLKGIGIAVPAANYYEGIVEAPSNFNWGKVNFVAMMREHYDLPVIVINDAKAAALGEMHYGAAQGMKNFMVITLGTGLGSGTVVNGNLLYGKNGLAGELGHVIIDPEGRECNCGRRGCLETYVSAGGICRTVLELLAAKLDESDLRKQRFTQLTALKIYQCALKQDPLALAAFDYTARILGRALADAAAHYSPEAIIISGGLAKAGHILLDPARHYFQENLLSIYKDRVNIIASNLRNGKAAILGAGSLIMNE